MNRFWCKKLHPTDLYVKLAILYVKIPDRCKLCNNRARRITRDGIKNSKGEIVLDFLR